MGWSDTLLMDHRGTYGPYYGYPFWALLAQTCPGAAQKGSRYGPHSLENRLRVSRDSQIWVSREHAVSLRNLHDHFWGQKEVISGPPK